MEYRYTFTLLKCNKARRSVKFFNKCNAWPFLPFHSYISLIRLSTVQRVEVFGCSTLTAVPRVRNLTVESSVLCESLIFNYCNSRTYGSDGYKNGRSAPSSHASHQLNVRGIVLRVFLPGYIIAIAIFKSTFMDEMEGYPGQHKDL